MKFWELVSIFESYPDLLPVALIATEYKDWLTNFDKLVRNQDRLKLDHLMPDNVCRSALSSHPGRLKLYTDGHLRGYDLYAQGGDNLAFTEMTYLEIYQKFGGSVIEDVLEKGSAKVL